MPLLQKAIQTAYERFTKKAVKTVKAGIQDSGATFQKLIGAADKDPFRQQLTADVLEAAARTAYEDKITALGRAWARGVLTSDDAVLAQEQQLVRSLVRIEYPHVRVLRTVSGDFDEARARLSLVDGWTTEALQQEIPAYGWLVEQLVSVLMSVGGAACKRARSESGRIAFAVPNHRAGQDHAIEDCAGSSGKWCDDRRELAVRIQSSGSARADGLRINRSI